jgi:hypothetical protein
MPPARLPRVNMEVGMGEELKRSVGPGQWAPWISDPDPPEEPIPGADALPDAACETPQGEHGGWDG